MYDVSIRLENKPGEMARMGEALGSAGVSVEGGGGWVVDGKGYMHFLFEDGEAANEAHGKLLRGGPKGIEEWNHGTMRIAFLILKSLKTEPLEQTYGEVVMVLCTSKRGLRLTPCLKHFLMRPNKLGIR